MTCGWTGVCRLVFRKLPSSNYQQLPSYPLLWWILEENYPFLRIFANSWKNHPYLRKICRKRDPCLENFWPKNPPIWVAHTRTLNMLCYPPPPSAADVAEPCKLWSRGAEAKSAFRFPLCQRLGKQNLVSKSTMVTAALPSLYCLNMPKSE